jgi:hypothetical protein
VGGEAEDPQGSESQWYGMAEFTVKSGGCINVCENRKTFSIHFAVAFSEKNVPLEEIISQILWP